MNLFTIPATRFKLLGIGIAVIQLFDIFIHAATNQLEALRVFSNIVILLWLAVVALGRVNASFLPTAMGAIGLYFILNVSFLDREGLTNAQQGGELRIMLFLLMLLTLSLSTLLAYIGSRESS